MQVSKVSIRFYNDLEIRAIWHEQVAKWYFSVIDIVRVLNHQSNSNKAKNYWKYLKAKLKKDNSQLVSRTTQLKMRSRLRFPTKKCI